MKSDSIKLIVIGIILGGLIIGLMVGSKHLFRSDTRNMFGLVVELRAPKKALVADHLPRIESASADSTEAGGSMSIIPLSLTRAHEEGEYLVFQLSYSLERAIVVMPEEGPSQVFPLSLPKKLAPTDWTQWTRPANLSSTMGSAAYDVVTGANKQSRATNIPPDSFELRYKITSRGSP